MFKHYLATAWRNFLRSKTPTLIGIAGLAIALACFVGAWGTIAYLRGGDVHFKNASRVYVITEHVRMPQLKFDTGELVASSPPVATYLKIENPELESVGRAANYGQMPVSVGDRSGFLKTSVVNPEFLDIFDFPFVTAMAKNPLRMPRAAVISEEAALQLFGTTAAVGKTLTLRHVFDITVGAVFRPIKQPSHMGMTRDDALDFQVLMTQETRDALESAATGRTQKVPPETENWASSNGITYALLPRDGSLTSTHLNERLDGFANRHKPALFRDLSITHRAVPLRELRLISLNQSLFQANGFSIVTLLMSLAAIVLAVACLNCANLATAQSLARASELGMRRILGASRVQIFMQQLIEVGSQTSAALVLALVITLLIASALGSGALIFELVARNLVFWIGVGACAAVLTLALATYNTYSVVRTLPIASIRGAAPRGSRGGLSILTGVQFAAASFLLIGIIVLTAQNRAMRNESLQTAEDPVLAINYQGVTVSYEVLKESLMRAPGVKSVSAFGAQPWSKYGGMSTFQGRADKPSVVAIRTAVRPNFDRVLGMQLLAGRSYSEAEGDADWPEPGSKSADAEYRVVIDRTMATNFGWTNPVDALNSVIVEHAVRYRVIGVLEDKPLRLESLAGISGNVYALMPEKQTSAIIVKMDRTQIADAMAAIASSWKSLVPDSPLQHRFYDEFFELEFRTFARAQTMLTIVASVGVAVAALGLFSIAVFVANRRLREIGVRKTLGARTAQIVRMLVRDFSRPVVIANVAIWPFAYLLAQKYLNVFVHRIELNSLPFAASLVATLLVAWLAVGGQAWRAARLNPADVLRHE